MEPLIFIQDLAVVMAVSAAILIICRLVRLPVVLGYILAGVLIGPNTPPYALVNDPHSIHTLSELGVIFLLFSIGLEFSLSRLARVGFVSLFAATLEIVLMIAIGYGLGRAFGWDRMNSLFLGAILSISSTTIIAKVLIDTKKIKEQFAQVILGILIIEDLLAIVIIAVLSGVASTGSVEIAEAGAALVRVLLFVLGLLAAGFLFVPRLIRYVSRFGSDEMLIVTALGLCLGSSLLAARFGFSVALGAFLIGAVIAETKEVKAIVRHMEPIRDMFTAIFFVSIGMLLSPQVVAQYWAPILILSGVTIAGKIFSCSAATFVTGYNYETSLKVGLGLAQIGEFSFIIARLGESTGVTDAFLYPIAVSVSGITTLTTPILMRNTEPIIRGFSWIMPRPIATLIGLYTGWVRKVAEARSEKRAVRMPHEEDVDAVFRNARRFAATLTAGIAVFFVGSLYLPRAPLGFVLTVFVLVSGFYLWGAIRKVHRRIEKTVLMIFDKQPKEKQAPAHKELVKLIQEEYPWTAKTEDFMLPFDECGANLTIRELRLRSESGATIVSIYRDDESIPNPASDMRIQPGDVLLLMGDEDQIRAGILYLQRKVKEPAPAAASDQQARTLSYEVRADFPFLGQTVRELRLRRRTGATMIGIQKDKTFISNPGPDIVIEEGDVLALFGLSAQLDAAHRYFQKI